MDIIYHITKATWWRQFSSADAYESETLVEEKFIHCSTQSQVKGVLERYFANQKNLVLIHINPVLLQAELKYEASPDGQIFPHVYGKIDREAVIKVEDLEKL